MAGRYNGRAESIRRAEVLVVLLGLLSCGPPVPTAPSPEPAVTPSPGPIGFVIVSGMNVLRMGETSGLTATAFPALTERGIAPPFDVSRQGDWASSDGTVAAVTSDGFVTTGDSGLAEVSVAYRGASFGLPIMVGSGANSGAESRYLGVWAGEAITTCVRISGLGKNQCDQDGLGGPDVHRHPVELTLRSAGDLLTGVLRLYQSPSSGNVRAVLLENGDLFVGGTLRNDEGHGSITQLRTWQLRVTRRGRMVGTVTADRAYVNIYGSQLARQRMEITAEAR